jgi:hypothetical protein
MRRLLQLLGLTSSGGNLLTEEGASWRSFVREAELQGKTLPRCRCGAYLSRDGGCDRCAGLIRKSPITNAASGPARVLKIRAAGGAKE